MGKRAIAIFWNTFRNAYKRWGSIPSTNNNTINVRRQFGGKMENGTGERGRRKKQKWLKKITCRELFREGHASECISLTRSPCFVRAKCKQTMLDVIVQGRNFFLFLALSTHPSHHSLLNTIWTTTNNHSKYHNKNFISKFPSQQTLLKSKSEKISLKISYFAMVCRPCACHEKSKLHWFYFNRINMNWLRLRLLTVWFVYWNIDQLFSFKWMRPAWCSWTIAQQNVSAWVHRGVSALASTHRERKRERGNNPIFDFHSWLLRSTLHTIVVI